MNIKIRTKEVKCFYTGCKNTIIVPLLADEIQFCQYHSRKLSETLEETARMTRRKGYYGEHKPPR